MLLAPQGLLVTQDRLGLQVLPEPQGPRDLLVRLEQLASKAIKAFKVSRVCKARPDQPDQPVPLELRVPLETLVLREPLVQLEPRVMATSPVRGMAEQLI